MDDEDELKAQCYGGEYMSEVFDPLVKRMSYRKQKRWWNAFMLFYTRVDYEDDENTSLMKEMAMLNLNSSSSKKTKIPGPIERSIQKQNVRFLHHRNHYTPEYFQFMRKIINANAPYVSQQQPQNSEKLSPEAEELAIITVQLASKFLFTSGLHTKKSLRGPAQEWYELLTLHLRYSKAARSWFCQEALFAHPSRFCEYILECPTAEVRTSFVRIIVFIAHFSLNDGAYPVPSILQQQPQQPLLLEAGGNTLSDYLLQIVLALLWMEVPEHGKHLSQYFTLFVMYASLGIPEKTQLLKLNVPATFVQVALDEGPGPPIKYQYSSELGKLYQVVSQLIRCCDISARCQSATEGKAALPNPYLESSCVAASGPIMPVQAPVVELIFKRYIAASFDIFLHFWIFFENLFPLFFRRFISNLKRDIFRIFWNFENQFPLLFFRYGYLKKLIEEANSQEDSKKLLQFCSWENPTFSHAVLYELLWQVAIAYTYELRPYLDLLLNILLMEDSWQVLRIQKTLKGIPDEHTAREGLFDIIQKSKSHYQKRAYQCIKLLVALFSQCEVAKNILDESDEIKRKWSWAVEWLNDELERGRGPYPGSSQFSYNNWSPPAQSNETANGYFLERSQSARLTLEKACELMPEEVTEY
jgi:ubiquitin carboxyl-terminal hydrolase 9/24